MKRTIALATVVCLTIPALAMAQVSVRPGESKPGSEERYTLRVPTEGSVATTMVSVEIPAGVTVLAVEEAEGATFDTQKQGDRIVAITWRKEIRPKEASEFVFRVRNAESARELIWKAHQHFADGTVVDWVGPAGDRRPAAVTKLVK